MWDGRDLAALVVPAAGKLIATGDRMSRSGWPAPAGRRWSR